MEMKEITELQEVKDWLAQFDVPDRYLAEYLLKKLRYISLEEVEAWIQSAVQSVVDEIHRKDNSKPAIAIFPVTKNTANVYNKDKELKAANDSSGRIGHALKNIERIAKNNIEVSPRLNSMKAKRVRHIVYVDDFTGSGKRFVDFWKDVSPGIKSWYSLGWINFWLVSYIGHSQGISHIVKKVKPLPRSQVIVGNEIDKSFISENEGLRNLCEKYGQALRYRGASRGYGELMSPVVFQYGCPNNVPGIFWSGGESREYFRPLFPNRGVSESLFPLFHKEVSVTETSEDLWILENYRLALSFIENPDAYGKESKLIVILAYLQRSADLKKIRRVMVMSDNEFSEAIDSLKAYGLIDADYRLTRFGTDVIRRGEKSNSGAAIEYSPQKNFYPRSFLGFQREIQQ